MPENREEFRVHVCRFYEPQPQPVVAIATDGCLLALSRKDGLTQIYDSSNHWTLQCQIVSPYLVSALTFCGAGRLFGANLQGKLLEFDLRNRRVGQSALLPGSACWSMAASPSNDIVAVGCESGAILFYSLDDESSLALQGRPLQQDGRVVSCCWLGGDLVTAGVGIITLWDVAGRRMRRYCEVATSKKRRRTAVTVWCVAAVSDHVIVSGDSTGVVSFWDMNYGILIQAIQQYQVDVLTVSVNVSKQEVYAAGVDPHVIKFTPVGEGDKWQATAVHGIHTHAVHGSVLLNEKLITAGQDCSVVSIAARETVDLRSIRNKHALEGYSAFIHSSRDGTRLALQYRTYLDVWEVSSTELNGVGVDPQLILRVSSHSHVITYSNISPCGTWLYVVYNFSDLKVYQLVGEPTSSSKISAQQVPLHCVVAATVLAVEFSSESRHFIFTSDELIYVVVAREGALQLMNCSEFPGSFEAPISQLYARDDKLVVSDGTATRVYSVASDGQLEVIADLPSRTKAHIIGLSLNTDASLVALTYADRRIVECSISTARYTPWTEENISRFPKVWRRYHDDLRPAVYIGNCMIISGDRSLCRVDQSQSINSETEKLFKSKRYPSKGALRVTTRYRFLLHLGQFAGSSDRLIAVEVRPSQIMELLPEMMEEKKFGT